MKFGKGTAITIRIVLLSALAAYTGIFLYQRYLRKKSDEAVDSEEDALKKLQEAKESILWYYQEKEQQQVLV